MQAHLDVCVAAMVKVLYKVDGDGVLARSNNSTLKAPTLLFVMKFQPERTTGHCDSVSLLNWDRAKSSCQFAVPEHTHSL